MGSSLSHRRSRLRLRRRRWHLRAQQSFRPLPFCFGWALCIFFQWEGARAIDQTCSHQERSCICGTSCRCPQVCHRWRRGGHMGQGVRFWYWKRTGRSQGPPWADMEREFFSRWKSLRYGKWGWDGQAVEILLRALWTMEMRMNDSGDNLRPCGGSCVSVRAGAAFLGMRRQPPSFARCGIQGNWTVAYELLEGEGGWFWGLSFPRYACITLFAHMDGRGGFCCFQFPSPAR